MTDTVTAARMLADLGAVGVPANARNEGLEKLAKLGVARRREYHMRGQWWAVFSRIVTR